MPFKDKEAGKHKYEAQGVRDHRSDPGGDGGRIEAGGAARSSMRNLFLLNLYRRTDRQVRAHYGGVGDETCGMFEIPSPIDGSPLLVVASVGAGWEHVSVSRPRRCPNWPEMCHVKGLFFHDSETVMQLHVPDKENISDHNYCLHLWRPTEVEIPRPPGWMVGGVSQQKAIAEAIKAGM